MEQETADTPTRASRRSGRIVAGVVVAGLLVWVVLAALQLRSAEQATSRGAAELETLRGSLDEGLGSIAGRVDEEGDELVAGLRRAEDDFAAAADTIASPVVAPLRLLPVLGRQVRSAEALSSAAVTLSSSAATAVEDLDESAAVDSGSNQDRLGASRRATDVLTRLSEAVAGLDLGPDEALLGPLASARADLAAEYDRLTATIDDALAAVTGVSSFLEGPTRYLVLAANNAEMRAGAGMPLQVGLLTIDDGSWELGGFVPAETLLRSAPGATLDPDVEELWGWLQPDQEWRNLNATTRFDEAARMATEMWAADGNAPVDGVLLVDVVGLASLLELTGPVDVSAEDGTSDTEEVTAETVVQDLLLGQYQAFPDDRDGRRERLGRVAGAVFEAFDSGSFTAAELLGVLRRSGSGRHLMLWSDDPAQQAGWEAIGASGVPGADSVLLSVLNRQGNKLDQFLELDATISTRNEGSIRRVDVTVELANTAPEGLPPYVQGPHPRGTVPAGDYGGMLALTLPAGAGNPEVDGAELALAGDDGPTRVVGVPVTVPRGETTEITIGFDLPSSWDHLVVLPSARVPPIAWTAGEQSWDDRRPRRLDLADLD